MKVNIEHIESTLGELWDVDVRTDYSGRGMAGRDCLALVTGMSGWTLAAGVRGALDYAFHAEEEDLLDYLLTHEPRTDNLGFDTIYYWPGLQVIED